MTIIDIPCITSKCLLLPICKYKMIIVCDILYYYFSTVYHNPSFEYITAKAIKELIPNIDKIYANKPGSQFEYHSINASLTLDKRMENFYYG